MDKINENEFEIQLEENNQDIVNDNTDDRIFNYDVKLQELYSRLDALEIKIGSENFSDEEFDEYNQLKHDIKILRKEKKKALKEKNASEKKSILEQLSIWIVVYGIVMTIICFPLITGYIWGDFVTLLINWFSSIISNITVDDGFVYNLWLGILSFSLPVLLEFVSWIVYVNFVNGKVNKWAFRIIWILQTILSAITIFILCKGITWA